MATRIILIETSVSYTPVTRFTAVSMAAATAGTVGPGPATATAYSPVQASARRYVYNWVPRHGPALIIDWVGFGLSATPHLNSLLRFVLRVK